MRLREHGLDVALNLRFGHLMSRHGRVGRVAHQTQDVALSETLDVFKVGPIADMGAGIELEVAGVDDDAGRRLNDDAEAAGDVVGKREELDPEHAELDPVAAFDRMQPQLFAGMDVLHFFLQHGAGQVAGVDQRVAELGREVGDAADVVVVTVGDNDAADPLFFAAQVPRVRNDVINAGHVVFGKLQTQVNDENVLTVLDQVAVPTAGFLIPAQGD